MGRKSTSLERMSTECAREMRKWQSCSTGSPNQKSGTSCREPMELMKEEKVGEDGAVHWERKYHCDKCNRVYSEVRLEQKSGQTLEDNDREGS